MYPNRSQTEGNYYCQVAATEGIYTNRAQTQNNYPETALKQNEATPEDPRHPRNQHKQGLHAQGIYTNRAQTNI